MVLATWNGIIPINSDLENRFRDTIYFEPVYEMYFSLKIPDFTDITATLKLL